MNISFKRQEDIVPSGLILLSIVVMVLTLLYILLVPAPTDAKAKLSHRTMALHMRIKTSDLEHQAAAAVKSSQPKLWHGSPEQVSADVLAELTTKTSGLSLKLGAFRPQRTQTLAGLTELPYSVQIAGTYKDLRTVLQWLDSDSSKLAIRSAQISASDSSAASEVTATVLISAYENMAVTPPATPASGTKTSGVHRKKPPASSGRVGAANGELPSTHGRPASDTSTTGVPTQSGGKHG